MQMVSGVTGKYVINDKDLSKEAIVDQMNEPRPLPMGRQSFHEWADRIISGAMIPGGEEDPQAFINSQKYALANCLMHLKPTESHCADAHFIHSLRKFAVNQVADTIRKELFEEAKERTKKKEDEEAQKILAEQCNETDEGTV